MEKNNLKYFTLLVISFLMLSVSSCSKDDEDNDSNNKSLIVGKWKIESSPQGVDEDEKNWIFNIKSDGTYSYGDGDEYDDFGTWTINDKTFNYASKLGLSFTTEIIELNKTTFTAKVRNPLSSGYITTTYKRIE
ncbi:lipocalin family protein [Dysgonomonas sp. BGC7]|uniref:lipocalin family protein n=1 Tax=Dysgonomonas sp. BGC7 TaxID=1658008 RepID=UPI000682E330|nr:lipocalin family protein [Dysgonomonas sp. BGC7]MBD8387914.1 lipocalin family protein [Dysgonomonas sp. BGC7]